MGLLQAAATAGAPTVRAAGRMGAALQTRQASQVPSVLLVRSRYGGEEAAFRTMSQRLQTQWRSLLHALSVREAADAGHNIHIDQPALVASVVQELRMAAQAGGR